MPKFTIETTYDLPVYRHTVYEAATADEAMAMAMADDDWSGQKEDIESGHDTRITGAWAGEEAYKGDQLPIPTTDYLDRFPAEVRAYVDRAYQDGYVDGRNSTMESDL